MGQYLKYIIPAIGITIGSSLYYAVTLLQEPNPISQFNRQVSDIEVYPGKSITITSDVVRTRDGCTSTIRRTWLDSNGNEYRETDVDRQALPAGEENFFVTLTIPPKVSKGTLRLHTDVEFYCNRPQKIMRHGSVLHLPDIFFRVSKLETK